MLWLFLSAAVAAVPFEYVVDCTGVPVGKGVRGKFMLTFRYESRDGDVITSDVVGDLGVSAAAVVDGLTEHLVQNGWRFEKFGKSGDETVFVIRGSKASSIKSVTFKGDVWAPVVTRRVAVPTAGKEAVPPPREKK